MYIYARNDTLTIQGQDLTRKEKRSEEPKNYVYTSHIMWSCRRLNYTVLCFAGTDLYIRVQ